MVWDGPLYDGRLEGGRAIATTSCPANTMLFGDWADAAIIEWSALEVNTDPYSEFKSGVVGCRAIWSVDVVVGRPAAFTKATVS